MTTTMPAVGARIRVTHTQAYVYEGVVASHDDPTGCVLLTDGRLVAVESDGAWTVTVEVLAPPQPAAADLAPQTVAVVGEHRTDVLNEETGAYAHGEDLPPFDGTEVREHPGTGKPVTGVEHPADGTLSPELSGESCHARTSHGHPCRDKAPSERPNFIARCGGVGMCKTCAANRDAIHGTSSEQDGAAA